MSAPGVVGPGGWPAGVQRVVGDPAEVAGTLRASGWRVGVAAPSRRTSEFYASVADALAWPPWFGGNLDALWDALTDLVEPTALVLADWTVFARARPERWSRILAVLDERAAIAPPFAVLLV
jgi:RNAse (barnase) inhibitor barstar